MALVLTLAVALALALALGTCVVKVHEARWPLLGCKELSDDPKLGVSAQGALVACADAYLLPSGSCRSPGALRNS